MLQQRHQNDIDMLQQRHQNDITRILAKLSDTRVELSDTRTEMRTQDLKINSLDRERFLMYRANLLADFAKKLEKRLRMAKVQKKGKSKSYNAVEDDPTEGKGHDITKLVAFVSNIEKKQLRSLDVDVKYMKLLGDFPKVTDIVLQGNCTCR